MKKLLQSTRFKKLLGKWLAMYICVMLLLTTVVTYSKYISSHSLLKDEARSTRFIVDIYPTDSNGVKITESITEEYRPTSLINYYFVVDTTQIEVVTDLYVTINANDKFEIVDIKDATTNQSMPLNGVSTQNKKTFYSLIDLTNNSANRYVATIKAKNVSSIDATTYNDLVTIGFSAIQVSKAGE